MAKKSKGFDLNSVLPSKTAEHFEIRYKHDTDATNIKFHKYGVVDFKNLSLDRANQLVNLGAEFIAPRNVNQEV